MYIYNYLICAISQMVLAAFIWRSASMGYAVHNPEEDFQSTLHRADESMYNAKKEYYERTGKIRRV